MIKRGQKYTVKVEGKELVVEVVKIFRQGEIWLKGKDYNNILTPEQFKELTGKDPEFK
jgi:hypothetical protein